MNKLSVIICALLSVLLAACHAELSADIQQGEGELQISLSSVSADVTAVKSAPSQLYVPSADEFNVRVIRNSNGAVIFDRKLKNAQETIKVASGEPYTIVAEYGSNPVLGLNSPYYVGTVTESVNNKQTKNIVIPCKVGNALISVIFGSTEKGGLRFENYFENCTAEVTVGDNMVYLPYTNPNVSAYLRADSEFSLSFTGVLRSTGESRSFSFPAGMLPQSLSAGEHLKVTLDIEAASGLDITISKAEITDNDVEQSIPYSWLPLPAITSTHRFDSNGTLLGTDIDCSESYPGCNWTAHIRNSSGEEVRTLHGKGALNSTYSQSNDWPYLPSGNYTADFSYEYNGKTVTVNKTKNFTVPSPSGIKASASGYTSYSRYLEKRISEANSCDAFTLYDIRLVPMLDSRISANANYSTLINNISGTVKVDDNTGNRNFKGIALGNFNSLGAGIHNCNISFYFDGAPSASSFAFTVTGLPVSFAPPTEAAGWKGHGTVKFNSDNVQLGRDAWSQPHYIDYHNIFVPMGTKVNASYDVNPHGATVQTTLTLYFGDVEYYSKKSSYMSDSRENGTKTIMASSDVTELKAHSSYGSGATRSYVYSLSYQYAE